MGLCVDASLAHKNGRRTPDDSLHNPVYNALCKICSRSLEEQNCPSPTKPSPQQIRLTQSRDAKRGALAVDREG